MKRALLAVLLGLVGFPALLARGPVMAADGEMTTGRFWYICDHLELQGEAGGEIMLLAALPLSHPGQQVTIEEIHPEPEAVIEDPDQGNRIVLWHLKGLREIESTEFYYDFVVMPQRYEPDIDPARVESYDTDPALFRRYTRPEHWIELTPDIRTKAAEIAAGETHPYRLASRAYDWVVANMTFDTTEIPERGAAKAFPRRTGDCGEFAAVFCALCRSLGVPARPVCGVWLGGGLHKWAEFYLPPYGWIPADPAAGQLIKPGSGLLSDTEIDAFLERRGIPTRDPKAMFGRRYADRVCVSHGFNIEVHAEAEQSWHTFHYLQPGGADAYPPAIEFHGLAPSVVHGGFFLFGPKSRDRSYAIEMAYQKLAQHYFDLGMFDRIEQGCNQLLESDPDDARAWLNLGRVYMGKREYYKAIASLRKAVLGEKNRVWPLTEVWARNLLGNCYDMVGHREMALDEYQHVIATAINVGGAVDYARKFINTPYEGP
jgi:hypothetical protein